MIDERDERLLRRAIELAAAALPAGDRPFGSLLVGPDDEVLAEARNTVATDHERSGLGRVVFALSTEQFERLARPASPAPVRYDGPALFEEARGPIESFFG